MKVSLVSDGAFRNTLKWLTELGNKDPTAAMHQIGADGVNSLASNTPRDTGETASKWKYKITGGRRYSEIAWSNSAHPESYVNMAKLIELGHGTNKGGYVQPRPYIHGSMDKVFKGAMDKIAKGLID